MAVEPTILVTPASLYVGDLALDVSDGMLFDAFSEFKSLASVRICRDSSTGRSLCYGYVNFISPQDAIRAIDAKNNSTLNGRVIRVMWSHRDSDARRSGIGNVFVKNLSDSIDRVKLQEMFQKFGNILSCKVVTSDDGKSKGYGFVQFDTETSAKAAIEKLNGSNIGGKEMYVAKFVKKSDRAVSSHEVKYTNLYMKNVDTSFSEEVLKEKFTQFGNVLSLVISKDENGASKGFGFVNFENPDDAKSAVEAMHGLQLGSKVLYVARAQKRSEREEMLRRQLEEKRQEQIRKYQASNVYVKNIEDDVTDDELWGHFSKCGTITSAKVMRDDKGVSKGFGFVCFSMPEEANKAIHTFHGYMLRRKPLYVSIAQRKDERQSQLQLLRAQHMAGLAGPSAVIPGGYPLYYPPSAVLSQFSPQARLMYQPQDISPGWRPNGFANPSRTAVQPSRVPLAPNNARYPRQNRGKMNGHVLPQGADPNYASHLQQPSHSAASSKDSSSQKHVKYVPNGRPSEMNKGFTPVQPIVISPRSGPEGSEMLSTLLSAAPPEQQKQILGERLYPLVCSHKPDLAAKITGMLLEMDNSELLLLLDSPESLSVKVEEAVEMLKLSKTTNQDSLRSNYLSAQVAVN